MVLRNDIDLIGDFLGTIPAMIEVTKKEPLQVIINDKVAGLFDLIPKKYGIERVYEGQHDKAFDLQIAFKFASIANLHMIQSHFAFVGLPIPINIPRPELEFDKLVSYLKYDYILAPFSRSLPPEQLWQQAKWIELVRSMPDKKFILFGNSKHDTNFINEPNCAVVFDRPFDVVCNLIQQSEAVISVVTGISHLCYALNKTNYLFFNQGLWGKNVDAICFDGLIPNISVEEVKSKII